MILSIDSLSFSYGSKQVLTDVSLNIGKGELVCLMGPNGAQLAEDVSCAFTIRIAETTCTCFCHAKDGIKAFLWSIAVFFCKIFKLVPVCACGKAHY